MKCLAEQQNINKKWSQLTEKYGTWILEFVDTIFGYSLIINHKFGFKRLQEFYDEGRRGLIESVHNYCPDKMVIKTRQGIKEADENTRLADSVDVTLDKFTKELTKLGFCSPDFKELDPVDVFSSKWHKISEVQTHTIRRAWYDQTGAHAIKIYVAGILLYLHERHGLGAKRLNTLYLNVSRPIRNYIERFMKSSIAEDQSMMNELEMLQKTLEEKGIEFIKMP